MTYTVWTAAAVVTGVGACIDAGLDATPESGGGSIRNPNMRTCLLVPGNISWDGCECGQLALTIQRIYPSQTFPADASELPTLGGCLNTPKAVQALASITRCVSGITAGVPPHLPTCAALQADGLTLAADAYAMDLAVRCCLDTFKDNRIIWNYRVGGINFVGPEGGCAGSELTFKFLLQ